MTSCMASTGLLQGSYMAAGLLQGHHTMQCSNKAPTRLVQWSYSAPTWPPPGSYRTPTSYRVPQSSCRAPAGLLQGTGGAPTEIPPAPAPQQKYYKARTGLRQGPFRSPTGLLQGSWVRQVSATAVCNCCLRLLFVTAVRNCCLQLLFVMGTCRAPTELLHSAFRRDPYRAGPYGTRQGDYGPLQGSSRAPTALLQGSYRAPTGPIQGSYGGSCRAPADTCPPHVFVTAV